MHALQHPGSSDTPLACSLHCREEKHGRLALRQLSSTPDGLVSEELCTAAATTADSLGAAAIFCFTRRGYMAGFLSRCRPDAPIFAFTGGFWDGGVGRGGQTGHMWVLQVVLLPALASGALFPSRCPCKGSRAVERPQGCPAAPHLPACTALPCCRRCRQAGDEADSEPAVGREPLPHGL